MNEILGTIILVCIFVFVFLVFISLINLNGIFESLNEHRNKKLRKMLLKGQYYEAAKYVFKNRESLWITSVMKDLNSGVYNNFFETLYTYAKFKCGTDGVMTISDVSDAIYYFFGDSFGKEVEPQVISVINNSIFISNKSHFWYSSYLTSGLLLLFLVENETITLTKDIPFEKIITNKLKKDEILDIIDENSKLFTKLKETKGE